MAAGCAEPLAEALLLCACGPLAAACALAGLLPGRGISWHMIVASQASLPSTMAVPRIFTAEVRQLSTLTSRMS